MGIVSERVLQMKKNFMLLHEKGFSIPEIAKEYDLAPRTVYVHLQEIADENGVTRSDLLKIIRAPRSDSGWRREEERVKVDLKKLDLAFAEANEKIDCLLTTIDEVLEEISNEE